jgi:hypothetical protein
VADPVDNAVATSSSEQTELVRFWKHQIDLSERTYDKFRKQGDKIYKRYRDVRTPREEAATRFNVLWSNVQTRLPALYARNPKPVVEQRYKQKDPVGRMVAEVLERSLEYTITHVNDFYAVMRQCVTDFELPGLGTVWIRYVPHFHKEVLGEDSGKDTAKTKEEGLEVTDNEDYDEDDKSEDVLRGESTIVDYVYWKDFGFTWARTWEEVRAVWRIVYLEKDEIKERFSIEGEELDAIPLEYTPRQATNEKVPLVKKKAVVYEIWDKKKKEVIWLVKNYKKELDHVKDPLKLQNFFPCPRPLFANLVNDELIPSPNFKFYQDQANEIDELSTRIGAITKALKVAGVRDASAEGLDRLLSEGVENALVPVDGWNRLKEAGGLKGAYELLPLEEIAKALGYLRDQRQQLIEDVYQITGMSDIIRGFTDPNETATAQQIKGQFGILRIQDAQTEVQRFARDTLRIMAEVVAGYDIETLKNISGVQLLVDAEKQAVQLIQQMVQPPAPPQGPPGAPPGQPPPGGPPPTPPPGAASIPPAKKALLEAPSWEQIEKMLKDPVLRNFHVDIETDSTIRMDEDADRSARLEFLNTASGFLEKAVMAGGQVPPLAPLLGEMLMFGIRSFRQSRSLEQAFETAMHTLETSPPPPKPDPEQMKVQAQVEGQKQIAQIKAQTDMQIANATQAAQAKEDAARNQMEAQRSMAEQKMKAQHQGQLDDMKNRFEAERTQYETAAKEKIANADNETKIEIARMSNAHQRAMESQKQDHEARLTSMQHAHDEKMGVHKAETDKQLAKTKASAPKAN